MIDAGQQHAMVTLARSVRYGPGSRHVLDIYIPAHTKTTTTPPPSSPPSSSDGRASETPTVTSQPQKTEAEQQPLQESSCPEGSGMPVVLFIHGGVWATGDKWQYAPMANQLAKTGVVTCVAHYSLFPDVRADTMVCFALIRLIQCELLPVQQTINVYLYLSMSGFMYEHV